eukprot:s3399_g2.t1
MQAAQAVSTEELQKVVERLRQEAAAAGKAREEATFLEEVALSQMREIVTGTDTRQVKRGRTRARNEVSERRENEIRESAKLLVASYQKFETLAEKSQWAEQLGRPLRLDSGSRPRGTAGFEGVVPHAGLRNLGNSCWLNAVLQCFYFNHGLFRGFMTQRGEGSFLGPMVREVLQELQSNRWDYSAPFELLHQLYETLPRIFQANESADARDACRHLLAHSSFGARDADQIVHSLETPVDQISGRTHTVTQLTQDFFTAEKPKTECLVLELEQINAGVDWKSVLVAPPVAQAGTVLYTVTGSGFVHHQQQTEHFVAYVHSHGKGLKCDDSRVTEVEAMEPLWPPQSFQSRASAETAGREQAVQRGAQAGHKFEQVVHKFEYVVHKFEQVVHKFKQVVHKFEQVVRKFEQVVHKIEQVVHKFELAARTSEGATHKKVGAGKVLLLAAMGLAA